MEKTAIIILAAGNSSRLGSPKQLLEFNGQTLIRHVVSEALLSNSDVLLVTGSQFSEIEKDVQELDVVLVRNPDWEMGMGSSVRIGTQRALELFPDVDQVILAVCDQPFVSASVFRSLIGKAALSPQNIVASSYSETAGTPVLFKKKYFSELLVSDGKRGAKKLVENNPQDLVMVAFPKGEIDIDTKSDYEKLTQKP
ncbi:nucleotidyltransferase family protein [Flavobacterium sp.]|uniref:nucleotidyltransferase family protein n=1 Tax=Flavobacterium sp. TaxID=239 RepID=UPI00120202AB|nr:nucleotidyltransferase family protein [Flavobacterium sp.]RZJ73033.1 MAG: nucleotidyltransferase family protein [Flavobacterium sp.]